MIWNPSIKIEKSKTNSCIPHKVLVAHGQPSYGSMYGPVITGSQNVRIDILRYTLHPYNSISVPFDSP